MENKLIIAAIFGVRPFPEGEDKKIPGIRSTE
jgi:hypothetical protein